MRIGNSSAASKLRLLAPCGIYCGLCSSRNRMPEQAQALRQTMANGGWDSLGREVKDFEEFWRFLNRITDPEESCPGCRTTGAPPFRGGPESCDIRECALKRKVDLCVNCRDWPCARIQRLGRTYLTLIADGKRLKKLGLDKWLKEQEARARTGFSYCDLRPPKGGDMENRDCPALLVPTVPRARSTQALRGTVPRFPRAGLTTKAQSHQEDEGGQTNSMKTKAIRQQVTFKGATPHELYEWLMDSRKHSRFTGEKADISRKVGGKFKAGGGWIDGMNLELVKDKLIVQGWRGNDDDWPKGYYSAVRFRFTKVKGGTRLDFLHSGLPVAVYEEIRDGWREYYWEPLKSAIAGRGRD